MSEHIHPAFLRGEDEDIRDKAESIRGRSAHERARMIEALCAFAAQAISQHPSPAQTLAFREAMPAESQQHFARLRARRRAERGG